MNKVNKSKEERETATCSGETAMMNDPTHFPALFIILFFFFPLSIFLFHKSLITPKDAMEGDGEKNGTVRREKGDVTGGDVSFQSGLENIGRGRNKRREKRKTKRKFKTT